VTIDGFSLIRRRYSKQCGPLFIVWKNVSNDLSLFKFSWSLKDLYLFIGFTCNAYMIHWSWGNNSQNTFINPFPKNNVLGEFNVLYLSFFIHIENLQNMTLSLVGCFQGNYIILDVHDGPVNFASWSLDDVHLIEQFNDAQLWSVGLVHISNADISLGF
jgi:hypothetical protein